MPGRKRLFESPTLQRSVHIDVFDLGKNPSKLVLFFGGSGMEEEEYKRREKTVVPAFDDLFASLPKLELSFVHVTAPFDVPFARFDDFPGAKSEWNSHVIDELLSPWNHLPFFVTSFSGGAALAFNGVHQHQRCSGGAVMGVDGLPSDFETPNHWNSTLSVFSAPNDRVANSSVNREIVERLLFKEHAEEYLLNSGQHRMQDYATKECLGQLLISLPN